MTYTLHWPPRVRAYFEFAPEEKLRNLLYLFSPSHRYGDCYRALGVLATGTELDVRGTMEAVAAHFPNAVARARFFVLTRNPVSQIHSHAGRLVEMAKYVSAKKQMREFHRARSREVLAKMKPRLARELLQGDALRRSGHGVVSPRLPRLSAPGLGRAESTDFAPLSVGPPVGGWCSIRCTTW
jgi:hypothetical protein